jgi:hypothetical protein
MFYSCAPQLQAELRRRVILKRRQTCGIFSLTAVNKLSCQSLLRQQFLQRAYSHDHFSSSCVLNNFDCIFLLPNDTFFLTKTRAVKAMVINFDYPSATLE